MDRRVVVSNAHRNVVDRSVARLAGVCGNNTLPATDRVCLCGVLIFVDRRDLPNVISYKDETIGVVPVRF